MRVGFVRVFRSASTFPQFPFFNPARRLAQFYDGFDEQGAVCLFVVGVSCERVHRIHWAAASWALASCRVSAYSKLSEFTYSLMSNAALGRASQSGGV